MTLLSQTQLVQQLLKAFVVNMCSDDGLAAGAHWLDHSVLQVTNNETIMIESPLWPFADVIMRSRMHVLSSLLPDGSAQDDHMQLLPSLLPVPQHLLPAPPGPQAPLKRHMQQQRLVTALASSILRLQSCLQSRASAVLTPRF